MTILVTGGTGTLGRDCVTALRGAHRLRILSRRPAPDRLDAGLEWVQGDLGGDRGLTAALDGVETILHLASDPFARKGATDVDAASRLLEAARAARVRHFIFISIVGIDRIPYRYYLQKLAIEALVRDSGLPWTTLRATQFHPFLDRIIGALARVPFVLAVPTDFRFQPVDTTAVVGRLAEIVNREPARAVMEIGGPETWTTGELVRTWLPLRRIHRVVVRLPLWGAVAEGFRQGFNTTTERAVGSRTWSQWLEEQAS